MKIKLKSKVNGANIVIDNSNYEDVDEILLVEGEIDESYDDELYDITFVSAKLYSQEISTADGYFLYYDSDSIHRIIEFCELIESYDEYKMKKILAYCNEYASSINLGRGNLEYAVYNAADFDLYENMDLLDVAEEYIHDEYFGKDVAQLYAEYPDCLNLEAIVEHTLYDYIETSYGAFRAV